MRKTLALIAPAALALSLAACGSNEPDDRVVDTGTETAGVDVNLPQQPVEYPTVATNARTSVDYAGTYNQRGTDGRNSSITLNEDDTYTMTNADGVQTSGTYNWYDDNSRILIRENGQNQVYAIADGAIYRMADENAPTTGQMNESQTYRRAMGAQPMADGNMQDTTGQ